MAYFIVHRSWQDRQWFHYLAAVSRARLFSFLSL
jgi:hypothetical protein